MTTVKIPPEAAIAEYAALADFWRNRALLNAAYHTEVLTERDLLRKKLENLQEKNHVHDDMDRSLDHYDGYGNLIKAETDGK